MGTRGGPAPWRRTFPSARGSGVAGSAGVADPRRGSNARGWVRHAVPPFAAAATDARGKWGAPRAGRPGRAGPRRAGGGSPPQPGRAHALRAGGGGTASGQGRVEAGAARPGRAIRADRPGSRRVRAALRPDPRRTARRSGVAVPGILRTRFGDHRLSSNGVTAAEQLRAHSRLSSCRSKPQTSSNDLTI